ncbi:Trk system potassium transporter TrkA [Haloarchaeobius sp. HME9146]|uniref:Trk system potassium transporter TrkA n=1 Tax=Haloarchaeobius sp. HME9146 TaxID=2978732 RepID=UPI0021C1C8F4|nr:Trk system potassium transporter TrkA [Haloarchaeobius sp. HME9146]MCT9096082.1 Trk system potassium transporter TrkA [Haloarchaeobius sp. HME9146]
MRVIVIGAGEVGSNIAASLSESHEVVVIDTDGDRVESLTYELDVLPIEGDGTSLSTLEEAGIEETDMLIASTDRDEANIVACSTAKTCGDPFTIARVKKTDFLNTWQGSKGAFGVDFMVCTDLLTAQSVVRIAGLPGAQDVDSFASGRVRMAQFEIEEGSTVANQTVQNADRFESLTFAAIIRNGDVTIPRGETVIEPGDQVIVIGSPESVRKFATSLTPASTLDSADEVFIIGGGEIGYQVARLFEARGVTPRLIEHDPERARVLADELPGTIVLENDATNMDFLAEENIHDADLVVSALESDEKNLLVSLLTKRLGARRTVAIVENGNYVELFEAVGVDVAVNPREVTAEEITRFTREEHTENVAIIESDRAEVLEIEIDGESLLSGRSIRDVAGELPRGVVIGAITRGDKLITPRGNTVVEPGDHIVVFLDATVLDDVAPKL